MRLITISAEAHNALLAASPTERTTGSMPTGRGQFLLQVDEDTVQLLNQHGPDFSATIIRACK